MEQAYEILADMSIDIDQEFAATHDLKYIPMEYMIGEDSHRCTGPESNAMMHEYYDKLRNKVSTHTSQITPHYYQEAFEPYLKEGKAILYLSLSSGLSNTYDSARMAAELLLEDYPEGKLEVVDSLGATGGMGILAECAIANREAGMSLEENAAWLRSHADRVNYWFKVEDLMYLMRGGRVSAATAVIGTALQVKPILNINGKGGLDTIEKKRGNRQAIRCLMQKFEAAYDPNQEGLGDPDLGRLVYISCADCLEVAEDLKKKLLESHPDLIVRVTMLSPIIGAHTGPDMCALIHFGTSRNG